MAQNSPIHLFHQIYYKWQQLFCFYKKIIDYYPKGVQCQTQGPGPIILKVFLKKQGKALLSLAH